MKRPSKRVVFPQGSLLPVAAALIPVEAAALGLVSCSSRAPGVAGLQGPTAAGASEKRGAIPPEAGCRSQVSAG